MKSIQYFSFLCCMRGIFCLLVMFFAAFTSKAQSVCKVFYPDKTFENIQDTATITAYLKGFLNTQNYNCAITLSYKTESPFSVHYLFIQKMNGIDIKDANIKINIAKTATNSAQKNGKIISIFSNCLDTFPNEIDAVSPQSKNNLNLVATNYQAEKDGIFAQKTSFVYVLNENRLSLMLQLNYSEKSGISKEVLFKESGIFSEKITSIFFDTDSVVMGKVFNPDPLTTAQVLYGSPYIDSNNTDVFVLNNQRQTKYFKATFDGFSFTLKNTFLQLQDLNGDGIIPVSSTTPVFDFTRAQNGFEDVNAFYHISLHRDYINNLGFTSANALVRADPHGTSDDNSYFTPPNSIYFGTGGVDDAEDADVLIHEYSHFVSYNSSPNSNSGFERQSLDEAIADYFAASYSKTLNDYNWFWVYNWDGHNEFWNGRIVNSTKHYPEDLSTTSYYKNAELFSSVLMEINADLGSAYTDSLVLNLLYFFTSNMTQPQAAQALLHCDTLLSGGTHFCTIYKHLYERGYLPFAENSCGVSAINEVKNIDIKLLNTATGFIISTNGEIIITGFEIYNLSGQKVFSSGGNSFREKEKFANGLYLIYIDSNQGKTALKWANF